MAAGAIPIAHKSKAPPEFLKPEYLFTYEKKAIEKIRNELSEDLSKRKEIRIAACKFDERDSKAKF
jgi:hypothetical protein